jgi:rsbT co-antagonist protein RsbR
VHRTFSFSDEVFAKVFPFYFVIGADFLLRSVGPSLVAAAPSVVAGESFAETFTLEHDGATPSYEDLVRAVHTTLVARTRAEGLFMRGEFASLEDDGTLVFLGSPWPIVDERVAGLTVPPSMLSAHDPTSELCALLEMQELALEEARDVAQRLEEQRRELSKTTARLENEIEDRARAEDALLARNRVLEEKERTILELSTPSLQVWEDVIAITLVGAVDPRRIESLTRAVAHDVTRYAARFVVVDLTGASAVDEGSVRALSSIASVARLLGARLMLTGLQPSIAQAMAALGPDLDTFESFMTVSDALRAVFGTRLKALASTRGEAGSDPRGRYR